MPEPLLEDFRRDLISHLDVPDFTEVVRRDQRNRRRVRVVVASVVASVLLGTAVALGNTGEPRSLGPTKPDIPEIKTTDASKLLARLPEESHPSDYTLSPNGDLLTYWTTDENGGACTSGRVFSWRGANGSSRAWAAHSRFPVIRPLPEGFVVGSDDSGCELGEDGPKPDGVYFVDSRGRRLAVTGLARSGDACAVDIGSPECDFSLANTSVIRRTGVAEGSLQGATGVDGTYWYQELAGSRSTIRWTDGEAYREQETPLTTRALEVNGDVVFQRNLTQLFRTVDHGRTWASVDISSPLAAIGCGENQLERSASTTSGTFAGVCRSEEGRVLFRSTDASWTEFQDVEMRQGNNGATSEVVSVDAIGDLLYAETCCASGIWISKDQGESWDFVSWATLR